MWEGPKFILSNKMPIKKFKNLLILQNSSLELGCVFCKQEFYITNIICHIRCLQHHWRLHFFTGIDRVLIVPGMNCLMSLESPHIKL